MSGYYSYNAGSYPRAHAAWVAQIFTNNFFSGVKETKSENAITTVYPNPTKEKFLVEFSLTKPEYLSFELYNSEGKLIDVLLRDWVKVNQNTFSFSTESLSKGIYFLKVSGNYNTNISKKIIVE
jgi:hypothetical protein